MTSKNIKVTTEPESQGRDRRLPIIALGVGRYVLASLLGLVIFYLSLVTTSAPISDEQSAALDRAIAILEERGFESEAFLLRHTTTFRSSDNWFNGLISSENAYAATNFPYGIVTIYPDFLTKTFDDTERAAILLHEARHLTGADEPAAYAYVWRNRNKLHWNILSHGTTPAYVTIELQTRENAPDLFTCPANLWHDCTETLRASR